MTLLLALSTSTSRAGVAVGGPEGVVASLALDRDRRHVEALVPAIEHVLALAGVAYGDLTALAVDVGPGLFTGLRVGLGTAHALAQALGLGVVACSSLDVLAHQAAPVTGLLAVVLDARRGEVYSSLHRDGDVLREAAVQPPEALAEELARTASGEPVLLIGDGAARYADRWPGGSAVGGALLLRPSAEALLDLACSRLAAGGAPGEPAAARPLYLRDADVRVGYDTLAGRVGAPTSAPAP